ATKPGVIHRLQDRIEAPRGTLVNDHLARTQYRGDCVGRGQAARGETDKPTASKACTVEHWRSAPFYSKLTCNLDEAPELDASTVEGLPSSLFKSGERLFRYFAEVLNLFSQLFGRCSCCFQ